MLKLSSKMALAAALSVGLAGAAFAGKTTILNGPTAGANGAMVYPNDVSDTPAVSVVRVVTAGGQTRYQVLSNGTVIATYISEAVARYWASLL